MGYLQSGVKLPPWCPPQPTPATHASHVADVQVFSAARLLFADDSRSNCRDVEKAFPGATVVHVQDDGRVGHGAPISPAGIGDAEADAIRAWLKKIASPS